MTIYSFTGSIASRCSVQLTLPVAYTLKYCDQNPVLVTEKSDANIRYMYWPVLAYITSLPVLCMCAIRIAVFELPKVLNMYVVLKH